MKKVYCSQKKYDKTVDDNKVDKDTLYCITDMTCDRLDGYVGIPEQGCGDLQLSWDKLKEKAKELGYIVSNNGYTIMSNDPDVYTYTMFYSKDGVINVKHYDKVCFVADHRTPDQMWQIMEALN